MRADGVCWTRRPGLNTVRTVSAASRPPLVGRTDELGLLSGALAAAGAGTPGVVLVSGEAGVGKTRLVTELAAVAARTGALVLSGTAVDVGESPPLLALGLAVRALDAEGRAALDPWSAELAGLGILPGAGAAAHPLDLAGRVLLGAAADRPVLWIVEDVQWADRATRDLVTYLTATMGSARLLVVVTHREGGGSPGLDELGLGGLRRHPRVHDLRLAPLDRASVDALVAGAGVPADLADSGELVWRRSRGNAFIAEETLRALRDRDAAALTGGLRDLVLGRVRALPPDARSVVRALSVAEGTVSHEVTGLVTALPADRLLAAVREAVDEGSVVVEDEGYRLRHGLAVDVVAADLLPAERRDLHRRHALALTELGVADPAVAEPALLAHHWDRAGDGGRARSAAAAAAEAAERVHGYADAFHHWQRVADLARGADAPDRAPALERAAEAAHLAGEHDAAITALRARLDLGGGSALLSRLGGYLLDAGRGTEAERVYREVLAAGTDAAALAGHAEALLLGGSLAEARQEAVRSLEVARATGALAEQARLLLTLGYSLAYLEDPAAGAAALAEGLRAAEESGSPAVLGRAYHRRAELLSGPLGAITEGIELALTGARRLTELGLGRTHGVRLLSLAANGQFRVGRWAEADAVIEQAFAARPAGSEAMDIRLSRGRMRVGEGDLAGAAEDLDVVEMLAHDTAGARYKVPLLTLRAGLAMFHGRPEEAIPHTLAGLALTAAHDDVWLDAALVWHGLRAHAECTRLDRPAPDAETVALLRRHAADLPARAAGAAPAVAGSVQMFALMSAAEVTRVDGASDPERWGEVAEEWERRDNPYNVAYGLLRRAEARFAQRTRSAAAADDLTRAHDLLVGLGARPLLAEVRDLARRARVALPEGGPPVPPVPVPAQRTDRLASLTPREREVLAEIAEGHTNREIARRLFISEKTVGIHVTHLFAKLGVRSRVQAGALWVRSASRPADRAR